MNQMKEKLGGREDLMKKMIPTTFGVGCRRPTVCCLLSQELKPITDDSGKYSLEMVS